MNHETRLPFTKKYNPMSLLVTFQGYKITTLLPLDVYIAVHIVCLMHQKHDFVGYLNIYFERLYRAIRMHVYDFF